MNILIDPEPLIHYPYGGIGIYQYKLLEALHEREEVDLSSTYSTVNKKYFDTLDQHLADIGLAKVERLWCPGSWSGKVLLKPWLKWQLPKDIDLIHFSSFLEKPWAKYYKCPKVLTIHDLAFMRHPNKSYVPDARATDIDLVSSNAKTADAIVTISEFTKNELCDLIDVDENKVFVSPLSTQWEGQVFELNPHKMNDLGLEENKYFISVSTLSKRKNFESLIDAFEACDLPNDYKLLIVGGKGWDSEELREKIQKTKNIVWLEAADTEDLYNFYYHAKASFLVSWYEGFGIPLLESMSARTPICYADGSSMNQVAGETGVKVNPNDLSAISSAMEYYASLEAEEYSVLQNEAYKQAKQFSWRETAAKTLAAYEYALGH